MLSNLDRWAVVAQIVKHMRANEGWAGETHIQKTLFFAQELLHVPCGYDYVLYKHGPYSFDLHDDLARMLTNLILGLEPRPPYGPSFKVEETGNSVIQLRNSTVQKYAEQIQFVVDTVGTRDVRELERLGTALLLKKQCPDTDTVALANKIAELKPHVPLHLASDAVQEANEIEAIAQSKGVITQ